MSAIRFSRALVLIPLWLWAAGAVAADWPQFMGPYRDLTTPDEAPGAPGGLKVKWKVPLTYPCYGSVVVAQGRVLTVTGKGCEARDAHSGVLLWTSPSNSLNTVCHTTPAVDAGRVYVNDAWSKLWCVNLTNGNVLWSQAASNHVTGYRKFYDNSYSPLVADGRVFLFAAGQTNCVMAFNATNGALLWKGHNYALTYASPVMATFSGVRQLLCQTTRRLVALAPEDGRLLWTRENLGVHSTPVPSGDSLVAPEQHKGVLNVFLTNNTWGVTQAWSSPEFLSVWTLPVVKDGYVYDILHPPYSNGALRCVRLADGAVQWSTNGFGRGSVILAGNRLVVLAQTGWLHIVNASPQSYQLQARCQPLVNDCYNLPAVADGHIYLRNGASFVCLDARPLLIGELSSRNPAGYTLTLRTQDASEIDAARASAIKLYMTSGLEPGTGGWTLVNPPRYHSNDTVVFTGLPPPPRFFRAYETNAP